MAESMLAILCHILRGEPVIQERLAKEREGTVRPEEEATTTASVGPSVAPGASSTSGEAPASIGTTSAGSVAGSADDSTNSTPRREPQVNQAQLTQVYGKATGRNFLFCTARPCFLFFFLPLVRFFPFYAFLHFTTTDLKVDSVLFFCTLFCFEKVCKIDVLQGA